MQATGARVWKLTAFGAVDQHLPQNGCLVGVGVDLGNVPADSLELLERVVSGHPLLLSLLLRGLFSRARGVVGGGRRVASLRAFRLFLGRGVVLGSRGMVLGCFAFPRRGW